MAPVNPPSWQQAGSYPARLDRLAITGLLAPDTTLGPLVGRGGVKPSASYAGLKVVQRVVPDMFVTVGAGSCSVSATALDGGNYICSNDAAYDLLLASSHPTLARKDLIVARVYDAMDDVGSRNEWAIESITGTPAASPVRPATPTAAIALAEVAVGAAATTVITANITDLRQYTVALGGILPVASQAQRDALAPYAGMRVYRIDTGSTETYSGTTWDGGGAAYSTEFVSGPASYTTDGIFVEFTAVQWPYIEIPCPASGAVAVSLRVEGYNSSTVSSSLRLGAVAKDQTTGGSTVSSPITNRGPCIIRSVAAVTTSMGATDRFILGGAGEFTGLTGHTLRIIPAWYISSHVNPAQGVTSGRMHVEPLDRKFVAL